MTTLLFVAAHTVQGADVKFTAIGTLSTGMDPVGITSADVNDDGNEDVIVANYVSGTLSVFTNQGGGFFKLSSSPNLSSGPWPIVAADVNGDGKVDLISGLRNTNRLSILTNNGVGNFAKASSPVVGNSPTSVVAVDVNSDGRVDLCCVNYYSLPTISVLTNDGSGIFSPSPSPAETGASRFITAADFNGDGHVDLASVDDLLNQLCVLTNNGTGTFVLASSTAIGPDVKSVTAGELNGDGNIDLATAHWSYHSISILTNDGTAGFSLTRTQNVGLGTSSIVIRDFNGDGKNDLAAGDYGWFGPGNTLSVFTNCGTGDFTLAAEPSVGWGPYSIATVDVNNDGEMDLISVNRSENTFSVLLNTSRLPQPRLSITGSNQWITLSWPLAWSDWKLQWSADLNSTNWTSMGGIPSQGSNKSLTLPRSLEINRFYRLVAP